jgi:hypothetical protein
MVRSYLAVAGTTVAALALASVINCGGSTTDATTGTGGHAGSSTKSTSTGGPSTTTGMGGGSSTSSSSSGPFMPVNPPPPPAMKAGDGTSAVTMAVKKLYIGDTDPDGTPDMANGWEYFGYNIDGVNPNDLSKFCKTVDNASPQQVHLEGMNGIENSFGHNILQIILGIASDASTKINDDLAAGTFTVMIQQQALGSGASYDPIAAQLFLGSNLGSTPKFDGTDNWPVNPVLLQSGTTTIGPNSSTVQFPMSYVTNNTWVSGTKGNVTLALSVSGYTLNLNIGNAVITMDMDSAHMGATKGVISGVLKTSDLTSQIQMVAGSFDPSLCSGPTIESIIMQLSQASDIMSDGTQDPTKTCDGISIGIGFDAALVENPTTIGPQPTMPANPCGDAG